MNKAVEITLPGTTDELSALFSFSPTSSDAQLTKLEDYIAHVFNQTLVRDHYYGAWAQVFLEKDGSYILKMYCAHHNLGVYQHLIPAFLDAGKIALSIFQANSANIPQTGPDSMRFVLPHGLSMAKTKSVQLLHFPPLEALVYKDYLYSPTNRRWENLMGYNKLIDANFPELESIVDCVPIAAPGDDSKGILPFNNLFTGYVQKMLQARLRRTGNSTQPVLAYGEPVWAWLEQAYPDAIKTQITDGKLQPLSLIQLQLLEGTITTSVLCANHPSKYLYYTDDNTAPDAATKKQIMTQDLIAAGWQARMAYHPNDNPQQVLQDLTTHWTDNADVANIMAQEDSEYGYDL